MLNFQKLDVYQRAVEFLALSIEICDATPRGHAWLLDQLRRAATSIPLNIGEASGRAGSADGARFYAIARGSATECAAVLDALTVMKVLEPALRTKAFDLLERIVAMLSKMCR